MLISDRLLEELRGDEDHQEAQHEGHKQDADEHRVDDPRDDGKLQEQLFAFEQERAQVEHGAEETPQPPDFPLVGFAGETT